MQITEEAAEIERFREELAKAQDDAKALHDQAHKLTLGVQEIEVWDVNRSTFPPWMRRWMSLSAVPQEWINSGAVRGMQDGVAKLQVRVAALAQEELELRSAIASLDKRGALAPHVRQAHRHVVHERRPEQVGAAMESSYLLSVLLL